jgi:hypothetical protein
MHTSSFMLTLSPFYRAGFFRTHFPLSAQNIPLDRVNNVSQPFQGFPDWSGLVNDSDSSIALYQCYSASPKAASIPETSLALNFREGYGIRPISLNTSVHSEDSFKVQSYPTPSLKEQRDVCVSLVLAEKMKDMWYQHSADVQSSADGSTTDDDYM